MRNTLISTVARFLVIAAGVFAQTIGVAQDVDQDQEQLTANQVFEAGNVRVAERYDSREDIRYLAFSGQDGPDISDRDVIIDGDTELSFVTQPNSQIVVFLQGGELTTVIDGVEKEREEGESWVIGPEMRVSIRTGDDSATFNWLEIALVD